MPPFSRHSIQPNVPGLVLHFVRVHLFKVLNNFMDVARRMGYCLQCVNHEKSGCSEADKKKLINKTIIKLIELMQHEIKEFITAVLGEDEVVASSAEADAPERGSLLNRDTLVSSTDSTKKGIFSLSISTKSNSGSSSQSKSGSVRTRRRRRSSLGASTSATLVTSMSASQFATTVLFTSPNKPSVRHALPLRKYVARWCDGLVLAVKELGGVASQVDQGAKDFLDGVIEKKLLPLLQADTVDSVVAALESPLAFVSPVTTTTLASHLLPDISFACSTLLDKSQPLFEALHRLPSDGEIFSAVLAVLEHSILTFISRAKLRSEELTGKLTSWEVRGGGGNSVWDVDFLSLYLNLIHSLFPSFLAVSGSRYRRLQQEPVLGKRRATARFRPGE